MFNHDDQVIVKNILKKDWMFEMRNNKNQKMEYPMVAGQEYALPGYMAGLVIKRIVDAIYMQTDPKKAVRQYELDDPYVKQIVIKVTEVMSPIQQVETSKAVQNEAIKPVNLDPQAAEATTGRKGREEKELDQTAKTLSDDELDSAAPMTNPDGTAIQTEEEFADADASEPENPAEVTEPVVQ